VSGATGSRKRSFPEINGNVSGFSLLLLLIRVLCQHVSFNLVLAIFCRDEK
jgi:hypothetical protein